MLYGLTRKNQPEAVLSSTQSPVGGWNAKDPISNMRESDAIDLENIFPTPADVMLRKGYTDHVTAITNGQVESLMAYSAPSGAELLFAAAGDAIYNATASTATASTAVSGFTNARWSHINFTNSGGTSYLLCVNGADGYQGFDGSTWSPLSLTGVTASNLVHISQHKRRVWFVKDNSLEAWFLNVDAVSGTASRIDLSGFCRKGGELMATAAWTLDAGEGVDDYWVAVTSQGEVVVYKGTDPTSASTWTMQGRWELGRPLSRRCFHKYAGDLLYLSEDGLWPLSQALVSEKTRPAVALSDKIQDAVRSASSSYRTNFGWQVIFWPRGTMVIVNVPIQEGADQQQYVMNSLTGAWCRFTSVDANCWEVYQGDIYFGGDGFVSQFWDSFSDDGVAITGEAKQAFNYFGRKSLKQVTMARPILQTDGAPSVSFGLDVDFGDNSSVLGSLSFTPVSYGLWDSGLWDVALWGGDLSVSKNWRTTHGIGFAFSPRMRIQSSGIEVHWTATDILYKKGGFM